MKTTKATVIALLLIFSFVPIAHSIPYYYTVSGLWWDHDYDDPVSPSPLPDGTVTGKVFFSEGYEIDRLIRFDVILWALDFGETRFYGTDGHMAFVPTSSDPLPNDYVLEFKDLVGNEASFWGLENSFGAYFDHNLILPDILDWGRAYSKEPDLYIEQFILTRQNYPIPEPSTIFLLGTGFLGLAGWKRRKFKKN